MGNLAIERKIFTHNKYYFFELFVLLFGFFLMSFVSYSIYLELATLTMTLIGYIILGLVHHFANHDLKRKIMIEYVLVGSIIFTAFIFLNASRL